LAVQNSWGRRWPNSVEDSRGGGGGFGKRVPASDLRHQPARLESAAELPSSKRKLRKEGVPVISPKFRPAQSRVVVDGRESLRTAARPAHLRLGGALPPESPPWLIANLQFEDAPRSKLLELPAGPFWGETGDGKRRGTPFRTPIPEGAAAKIHNNHPHDANRLRGNLKLLVKKWGSSRSWNT